MLLGAILKRDIEERRFRSDFKEISSCSSLTRNLARSFLCNYARNDLSLTNVIVRQCGQVSLSFWYDKPIRTPEFESTVYNTHVSHGGESILLICQTPLDCKGFRLEFAKFLLPKIR